jgi:hypothetical protein
MVILRLPTVKVTEEVELVPNKPVLVKTKGAGRSPGFSPLQVVVKASVNELPLLVAKPLESPQSFLF